MGCYKNGRFLTCNNESALPIIAGAVDWIAKIAVGAVNILGTFVDGAYKFVNFYARNGKRYLLVKKVRRNLASLWRT